LNHNQQNIIQKVAIEAIENELNSLKVLPHYIQSDFIQAIEKILSSNGRVVLTGIGKSAIIAQKISATMNSTGQPALFMHAADAIHGDLGMIQQNDVIIAISKSGNTPEIKALAPLLKQFGNTLIAIVGNINSELAKIADLVIDTTVDKEACPNNLAPTTSTTAQLIMGDAIAVALLQMRDFSGQDFSKFHPGGALGKKLYLKCEEIAQRNQKPSIKANTHWKDIIVNITENRLGATAVLNDQNEILGIITDGDIRRMLNKYDNLSNISASDIMSQNPLSIDAEKMATEAGTLMQDKKITQLIVTKNNEYFGFIHLHDLYSEGII
jgi:arabinose-5-phosphate isomerase